MPLCSVDVCLALKCGWTMCDCRHHSCIWLFGQESVMHDTFQFTWILHDLGSKNCKHLCTDLFLVYMRSLYLVCWLLVYWWCFILLAVKLKFQGTNTDTDINTDFLADFRIRILVRKLACPARAEVGAACRGTHGSWLAAAHAARSGRHEPDTHDDPRRLVRGLLSNTRAFPREDVRWGCARVHVYVYCTW